MVLVRVALALALLAGCKQSLFDSHGDDTANGDATNGGDGTVPTTCPATCLGDAAADFGTTKFGYFEDTRNRMWTPMTQQGTGMYVGADPKNAVAKCPKSGASACDALPGALLVSSSGATAAADPAIAFKTSTKQVVQLSVRIHVPSGASVQQVRLYRNSREDVLYTGVAMPGVTFEQAVTVDALPDDRYFVALAPTGPGAADVGVHFFVSDTGMQFPASCQSALTFTAAAGNTVENACGSSYTSRDYNNGTPLDVAPTLGSGPFPEIGMAADIVLGHYYAGNDILVKADDTTTQLWVRHDAFDPSYAAWAWSDLDLNAGGGLEIAIFDSSGVPMMEIATCTDPNSNPLGIAFVDAPWPNDHAWHFVRVVHTMGQARLCIDGKRMASLAAAQGTLKSTYAPRIGRNVVWTPAGAFFDGGIDDVRVFSGALPCE